MASNNDHDDYDLWTSLGAVAAVSLCSLGAAIASTAAAPYAMLSSSSSSMSMVPMFQAAVLGSYGIMIAVAMLVWQHDRAQDDNNTAVITTSSSSSSSMGYRHLAAGLVVGLSCVVSGATMRSFVNFLLVEQEPDSIATNGTKPANQPRVRPLTPKAIGLMIFMEVLGLYGFLIALLLIFWPQERYYSEM